MRPFECENRSILVSELKRAKKNLNYWEMKYPNPNVNPNDRFACVAINLSCGCKVEYHDEKDIPHNNSKCDCGNYYVKYNSNKDDKNV